MRSADHIIDIGPGAGFFRWICSRREGTPEEIMANEILDRQMPSGKMKIDIPEIRRKSNGKILKVLGASGIILRISM